MSTLSQFVVPKSKFSVDDIPDLSGKVVIVTGGYTGIGKETVEALLSKNAKVYIAGRNASKAKTAIEDLRVQTVGKVALFLELDLASLSSVKKAAETYLEKETELHILFNNGGVMEPPVEQLTSDGYDLQFGTNVLGHFYFTKLLLPTLISTAERVGPTSPSRVVNTASFGHTLTDELDFETLRDGKKRIKKGTAVLYYQSKLGNVVYATELARRYGEKGIVSTSLNPGNLRTELGRSLGIFKAMAAKLIGYPTPMGALTQLYAGTMPEGAKLNGKYLIPWARVGIPSSLSQDPEIGKELWDWLQEQVEKFEQAA